MRIMTYAVITVVAATVTTQFPTISYNTISLIENPPIAKYASERYRPCPVWLQWLCG